MKKIFALIFLILITSEMAFCWGKTGHRVVGQIAYNHLNKKARKNIQSLLGQEHLGMVGNYMDLIRADRANDYMAAWHYCTVPDSLTYEEAGVPEEGDVVQTIIRLISELKTKQFTDAQELESLKYLVHLVGDIHQPLHVGNGLDLGGNEVKVEFFWERYSLHRVWDSGLIDHQQLSYTEYVSWIDHAHADQIKQWQEEGLMVWVDEALGYRKAIYDIPENKKLFYEYNYTHIGTVNERLLKAGIRLAGILNEIYG